MSEKPRRASTLIIVMNAAFSRRTLTKSPRIDRTARLEDNEIGSMLSATQIRRHAILSRSRARIGRFPTPLTLNLGAANSNGGKAAVQG